MRSLACDIRDLRRIEKRGSLRFMERAFMGFRALPEEATDGAGAWWQVLGLEQDATEGDVLRAYRRLAHERHPDKSGGSRRAWDRLQQARREALRAVENRTEGER
jgi:DnaJ-class molecular chaperone